MAKEMKTYRVDVDHPYGTMETYTVEASSVASARKKAKARYVKDIFTKRNLKTFVYGHDRL